MEFSNAQIQSLCYDITLLPSVALGVWFKLNADKVAKAKDKEAARIAQRYLRGEIDTTEGSEAVFHLGNHPGDAALNNSARELLENAATVCLVDITPLLMRLSSRIPALKVILDGKEDSVGTLLRVHDALNDYVKRSQNLTNRNFN